MRRNILCGVIGFFGGTVWILICWVILACVKMFSPPELDKSFLKKIESEPFSEVVITYKKKNIRTGDVLFVRFTVGDKVVLSKLQATLKTWKFTQTFRTVEFEPCVQVYTSGMTSPWKISFEGRCEELFLSRNGQYCIASVYGDSFYNEVLNLVRENEKNLTTGSFQIEL